MKNFIPLLLVLFSPSAFARWPVLQAKWIERDYENQVGIIHYLDHGAPAVIEERRQDAKEKMTEFCGRSKYSIVREVSGAREVGGSRTTNTSIAVVSNQDIVVIKIGSEKKEFAVQANFNYIAFRCSLARPKMFL